MNDDLMSRSTIKHAIYDVCLRKNNIDIFEELLDRINELPSVNSQEPFMNKPCVAHQICHEDKVKLLDNIRAEIIALPKVSFWSEDDDAVSREDVLEIIDNHTSGKIYNNHRSRKGGE